MDFFDLREDAWKECSYDYEKFAGLLPDGQEDDDEDSAEEEPSD